MNHHAYPVAGRFVTVGQDSPPQTQVASVWPWLAGVAIVSVVIAWALSMAEKKPTQKRGTRLHIDFPQDRGTRRFR